MSQRVKERQTHKLTAYVTEKDYERTFSHFHKTTCRTFSEFLRNRCLSQPETVFYRNQSADDFLPIAIALKDQLVGTCQQIVQAIHMLTTKPGPNSEVLDLLVEKLFLFEQHTEEIRERLNKIYEQWLQK